MAARYPASHAALLGIALVLVSAAALAIVPTAAKMAFLAGSNTLTLVTTRAAIAVALISALIAVSGHGFRTNGRVLKWCLVSGILYTIMSYAFIGSVLYIPVSLMMLIYFTHPILIALIAHWRGKKNLSSKKLIFAIGVFLGLSVVVGPNLASLDPFGVMLALVAAFSVCGVILVNAKALNASSSMVVNLYMTAVTVVVFALATPLNDEFLFPRGALGWVGLFGAGLGQALGLLTFLAAFRYIGPVRATMISSVEPLMGVLFAVAVLGESLGPHQWVGALIVVAALILFELPERRRDAAAEAAAS